MTTQEPLSDDEIQDVLHRMAFDLTLLAAKSTRGDTAIKTARKALLLLVAALIAAEQQER